MRTRGWLALATVVAAIAGGALWRRQAGSDAARLPAAIVTEEVIADLSAALDPASVVTQATDAPVRAGQLRPGNRLSGGGERPALVTPAGSRLRFQLDAPSGAVLRFGVGIEGGNKRRDDRTGARFAVTLNGREAWTRTLNPAATKRDRSWSDARLPLPAGPLTLELSTTAERPDLPLAGTPGWGTVRVVRETTRPRQASSPNVRNVLVLLVDTLRADRLGCYGASPSPSPTLDALAARGLLFEQAVAQSTWTLPSVSSILTGLHPRSHGALGVGLGPDDEASWGFLADGVTTWAEVAGRAGITTVGVSANPLVSRATNLAQGFEVFLELPWDAAAHEWPHAREVNAAFLGWLRRNPGQRFLAYLHYMEPHDPYTPAAAFRPPTPPGLPAALAAGWIDDVAKRINFRGGPLLAPGEIAYLRALYDGEIRTWDSELARLEAGLTELGLADSTVVLVTADHGEEFQEHGRLKHGSQLYDETLRVPLVVTGPGLAPARQETQVQGIDLFPTLAALLDLPPSPDLPGQNLLAPLAARVAIAESSAGIAPGHRNLTLLAVRTPDAKVIHVPALGRQELYDLQRDPGEQAALVASAPPGPALAAELAHLSTTAPPPPATRGRDPQLHEKLRNLGYVE